MVNRAALLIVVLSVIFVALGAFLLHLQLPPDTALTDLLCAGDSLPLLLVQSYTLPRISIALLAGGGLAFAALLLQQVMSNPLASDNTLGISGGAQFGLFLSAIFAPQLLEYGSGLIALLGTSLSLLLVMSLSLRKTMSPLLLILAGLVVNLYLGAFTSMMMLFYPEESRGLAQWGAGSLVQESWRDSQWLLAQSAVGFCLVFSFIRPLTILTLNDSNAQSLGVPVGKLRLFAVIVSAYLIAAVVSAVGMLGFIGLAAATIVRQLGVRTLAWQLISAFLVGALLLAITDLLLQLLNFYTQLSFPTGAVTALLGTPLLLWLMFRALPHSGRLTGEERKKTTPISTALYLAADYSVRRQFVAGAECRQKRVRSVVGAGFQSPVCAGNPQSALSAHFNRAVCRHFAVRCRRVIAAPDLKPNGKPGIIGRVFWSEYGDFAAIVRVFRPAAAVVLAGGHRRCTGRPVDFIRD
mgnify:CR=1 FL=1